ncbi:O-methyltransferase [Aspergillus aurantiobrunneus]
MAPSYTELATRLVANAAVLDYHLNARKLATPPDSPSPSIPARNTELEDIRAALVQDTKALRDQVLGPAQVLRELCWSAIDLAVQGVIYRFGIYKAIPLEGAVSYALVAEKVGLSERQVKLMLRQSALNGIFYEPSPAHVAHTAASAVLVQDKAMLDWYGHCTDELFQASAKLADALEKNGENEKPEDSAFSLAFGTNEPIFNFYEKHPERQARFFGAMEGVGKDYGHSLSHVVNGYGWAGLGDALVVDVGGSSGFLSTALAAQYPNLTFEVQDYEHTIQQGAAQLPSGFADRVKFTAHNFFDPQPSTGDVYLLRHICHNWSDTNSAKIIQQILPAMKPTSRVLLVEVVVVPPRVVNVVQERYMRNVDVTMLQMLNTQERSEEDWQRVVAAADPRLQILGIYKPEGSWDSIIEIGFSS